MTNVCVCLCVCCECVGAIPLILDQVLLLLSTFIFITPSFLSLKQSCPHGKHLDIL